MSTTHCSALHLPAFGEKSFCLLTSAYCQRNWSKIACRIHCKKATDYSSSCRGYIITTFVTKMEKLSCVPAILAAALLRPAAAAIHLIPTWLFLKRCVKLIIVTATLMMIMPINAISHSHVKNCFISISLLMPLAISVAWMYGGRFKWLVFVSIIHKGADAALCNCTIEMSNPVFSVLTVIAVLTGISLVIGCIKLCFFCVTKCFERFQ